MQIFRACVLLQFTGVFRMAGEEQDLALLSEASDGLNGGGAAGGVHVGEGVVEKEDSREDLGGEASRDRPTIWLHQRLREFLAVFERDRRVVLGMDEEVVLREEAGEQQAVPLLVGAFGDKLVQLVAYVAELENSPQKLLWGGIRLAAREYPVSELTLTVYTLSLDSTWLVV